MRSLLLFVGCFLALQSSAEAACGYRGNPHSFDCLQASFSGFLFPLKSMEPSDLRSTWTPLVAAMTPNLMAPWGFQQMLSPMNPLIPTGVMNESDGSPVGPLTFAGNQAIWPQYAAAENVLRMALNPTYPFTLEMKTAGPRPTALQCRIFIREGQEHLICRLFRLTPANTWFMSGYFGFLRGSAY